MANKLNIVEKLTGEPQLAIFVKGLIISELIDKLKSSGPFTVLAPTNLAFSTLPETKLIELMKPINKKNLAEIMKYHIIEGKLMSDEIAALATVKTLQEQRLRIEATNFCFKVNGANLQSRNIEVSNGVIHEINAVLFPAIATEAA